MKKVCVLLIKLFGVLLAAGVGVFGVLQAVYWLNLDNKLMFVLHRIFNKITDRVPRDRRF
ncbi:MAG: hypothetical protein IJL00_02645 [Clostridia bacterium]|nr:hypothetical protein [Clostridia bacterium]